MSHSYVSNLMHCTFSTKNRYPAIDSELESRFWPYLGGIAKENRMKALAIGGTADHVHALLSLPGMMSFAKAVQLIKGGSSKWIHDTFPNERSLHGRKATGHLVSAPHKCGRQWRTSPIKRNIIGKRALMRSFWSFSRSTGSNSILATYSKLSAVRYADSGLVFGHDPTDKSVGYFRTSAKRTHKA